ncbi:stress protein [Actinoplanes lobatus]|uniref:Putative alkaline shock family protein YloU n=1 Tax=Actinoplanes lobatus TaxID=113568 RepID=A0A7W7HKX7_9ACTN|nr:Asp23/Gls24 family envelope stress response protein [Actinoplanes lobatus]MBB4752350.1 putative alkaline shock family protein YloU [Actinoplanes lobatus]GGN94807.1 stress protein [Actinoplanes lobatus]GIE45603.1 stress protein [Actinoplanes lobatus]
MTTQTTRADPASQQAGKDYKAGSEKAVAARNKLNNDEGKISVAQGVVQKIAGMACREMSGVHSMGTGGSRAFGAIRERIPGSSGPNVAQGVGVEVGETQAAIDLDIVVEYGVSVVELGRSIQRNVKTSIERMTGLEVVEVNVNVDDVNLPDTGDEPEQTRVS